MVDLWEHGLGHQGGEVVGEDFLGPYVIEPFHRDQVSEPHMGGLVGYELLAFLPFLRGRGRAEEHCVLIVQHRSGMLHSSELETRYYHEIVFGEGQRNSCIFFHEPEGFADFCEHVLQLGQPALVVFPVVCGYPAACHS